MKKIYYFIINGKILADDEDDADNTLKNILNNRAIETFKIESLLTEAR